MGDLVLKGGTSGQITLTPTAVAGTNTLTLPAKTGNIITSADSGTVTQTMLGTNVAGNGPAFYAYRSGTDQTISFNSFTKIEFNSVASPGFNIGSYYDATTNFRFTPLVAGYYQVNSGAYLYGTTTTTYNNLFMYKNGNQTLGGSASASNYVLASGLVYLNGSTDYIEIYGFVLGTGTATIVKNSEVTWFQAYLARTA